MLLIRESQHGNCCLQLPDAGRVELGATWLHGLKGNPMYELALQYGLMNGSEQKQASEYAAFS